MDDLWKQSGFVAAVAMILAYMRASDERHDRRIAAMMGTVEKMTDGYRSALRRAMGEKGPES